MAQLKLVPRVAGYVDAPPPRGFKVPGKRSAREPDEKVVFDFDSIKWMPRTCTYENDLLDTSETIFIDTETTGLRVRNGDFPFMATASDVHMNSWCHEWPVHPVERSINPDRTHEYHLYLKEICENDGITKGFFNAKFDIRMLKTIGIYTVGRIEEVGFQARTYRTAEPNYKLKSLCNKYLGMTNEDETFLHSAVVKLRKRAKASGFSIHDEIEADYWLTQYADTLLYDYSEEDLNRIRMLCEDYGRKDAMRTSMLFQFYDAKFAEDECFSSTYGREMKLWHVIDAIEDRGIMINKEIVERDFKMCTEKMEAAMEETYRITGDPEFNLGSPKQLIKALYGTKSEGGQGLVPHKLSPKGSPSTDWFSLLEYMDNELVQELMAFRMYSKGCNTFFKKYLEVMLPDPINPGGMVLCPGFNQCNTRTGRFSCSEPNLQQVSNPESSIKGAGVIQAKSPFGPRPGFSWYLFDYSGMELRIFAGVAQIPRMIEAMLAGRDLNNENVNKIWGGKGNPASIPAAIIALNLNDDHPSNEETKEVWDKIHWDGHKGKHSSPIERAMAAELWLEMHNYQIGDAEKSLGKSGIRSRCKMCTFAKLYGGGWRAVQGLMYCTEREAKQFLSDLSRGFPEIDSYSRVIIKQAERDGFIINKYGRKIYVDKDTTYKCVNYMIQGTAADMMKDAVQRVHDYYRSTGLDAHVCLTIHDELIVEIRDDHAYDWLLRGTKTIMEDHEDVVGVPMPVAVNIVREYWHLEEGFEVK